mgnify:CR=1 FL=1
MGTANVVQINSAAKQALLSWIAASMVFPPFCLAPILQKNNVGPPSSLLSSVQPSTLLQGSLLGGMVQLADQKGLTMTFIEQAQ